MFCNWSQNSKAHLSKLEESYTQAECLPTALYTMVCIILENGNKDPDYNILEIPDRLFFNTIYNHSSKNTIYIHPKAK